MDETEDDIKYPLNTHSSLSDQQKVAVGNVVGFTRNANGDDDDDDEDDDVEIDDEEDDDVEIDDEEDDEGENAVHRIGIVEYGENDNDEEEDDDYGNIQRHPKKRKLKSLLSSYELAPRVPEASASTRFGGRNTVGDWSEHETLLLLGAWGGKYLQHRRKSLRSDEWQEVAEKVSQGSKIDRTDSQCRNRLDTLKKKYKKEKAKMIENGSYTSKWIYFNRMDSLISSSPLQAEPACDLDSGEYVLTNHKEDYNNHVNRLDETRDSPGNLNSEEDSEGVSSNKTKNRKDSFKLLANCVLKFSKIYEKVEFKKRQQMLELEKMRMDFLKDLESQRKQILQRAQAEITRIRQGDSEENDASALNTIG